MSVTNRVGPIFIHAVQSEEYRKNYDKIFGKKPKAVSKIKKRKKRSMT